MELVEVSSKENLENDEISGITKLRSSKRKTGTPRRMEHRRSSRKCKQLMYIIIEETTDEDEYEYQEDEPNYPLPPIIQVPCADGVDEEIAEGVPMKGLMAPRGKGCTKRNLFSQRICAKTASGESK